MKQTLESLILALTDLQKADKTKDVVKLEEKVSLIIKDLNSLITEDKYSKDDKDLKQKVDALGEVIKNLDQNQENKNKTFTEFVKYLKDRKIN
tara:strand:+ start:1064 stop:1342 length:279 start_codon:yes stop_codon:yes gene_type:complete